MEAFFDPDTKKPVQQIDVAEGVTKILGLKKFTIGDVAVRTGDYNTAFVDMVIRLKDTTKQSYDKNPNQHAVAADTNPVIVNDTMFFQVLGNNRGSTELTARFTKMPASYASTVTINVAPNKKRLLLFPNMPFSTLWANHPRNPQNRSLYDNFEKPCKPSTWLEGQCMIRLCAALEKGGIKFDGLSGVTNKRCNLPGKEHENHYFDPYDFERWKGVKDAYVFEAKQPLQLEPMPGIAAYYFTMNRTGVILFYNYFPVTGGAMVGGHIDLWNKDQMGNTIGRPQEGLSAFVRSNKIVFWPLD